MGAVIINGVLVGLIYGLYAIGLVVVYRGSRVVHLGYAETGMVAALFFTDFRFGRAQALIPIDHGFAWALPAALAIGAGIGVLTEFFVARPTRTASRVRPLMGTFGVGILLATYATNRWGTNPHPSAPLVKGGGFYVFGTTLTGDDFLLIGSTLGVCLLLWLFYGRTAPGRRLRAVALDPTTASLSGINVNTSSALTWSFAGALAAYTAILYAPRAQFDVTYMTQLTIFALAAALVGGMTSIAGALGAAIVLGVGQGVVAYQFGVPGLAEACTTAFILILLLLRPRGLVRAAY